MSPTSTAERRVSPPEPTLLEAVDPDLLAGRRILVVDDEEDILESVQASLEDELAGVFVVTASTPQAGLDALEAGDIDLIVADYRMPVMDGLAFLEQAEATAPDVPRILITAFPDMDVATRAINERQVDRFLMKPLDPQTLLHHVRDVLMDRGAEELRERVFYRLIDLQRPEDDPDRA